MRFPRSFLLVLGAVLALASVPAVSAAAIEADTPSAPAAAAGPSDRAEQTLAAVQAAFAPAPPHGRRSQGHPVDGREVTLLLARLRTQLDDLDRADRRIARSFLARPTDGTDPYVRYSRRARATNDCRVAPTKGSKVCVHWARATHHAPPPGDRDRDRLPNQVEKSRNVANRVWERIVTDGGYRRPPRDHGGPNRRLDVYLANIGAAGLYGYCVAEDRVSGRAYTGYCVLDNDYSRREFPANTPNQNLKVTVAHEFFHAVQFGYDAVAASWFMEGSAAWVEDEVYDAVNDNRLYLPTSPLAAPQRPLDRETGLSIYGSWIFWRFLTERYAAEGGTGLPLLMRRLWEDVDHRDATKPGLDVVSALRGELGERGTTIPEAYADFSVANRRPSAHYEEGAGYRPSPLAADHVVAAGPAVQGVKEIDHLASATVRLRPHADLAPGSSLELTVTEPLGPEAALRVVVVERGGAVRTVPASPTPGGWTVPLPGFDTTATSGVEVTLVNGRTHRDSDDATFGYTAGALPPGP